MAIPKTEEEWLGCQECGRLIWAVESRVSVRKLRLFAVAWCRRRLATGWPHLAAWPDLKEEDVREAVALGERLADGNATEAELAIQEHIRVEFWGAPTRWSVVAVPGRYGVFLLEGWHTPENHQLNSDLVREVFGNPFRPVILDPSWLTSDVVALARGIYDERAFDRMPILADALQDAGCDDADILAHCRETNATHVRGCWVVDLVLDKK